MKTTLVLLLSAASLIMLAGCGKKSSTDAREGFTITITGNVFLSNITAQNLTIDWGDGITETFESCDKRSIKHTYKESDSRTVTAITENLTGLDVNGNSGSQPSPAGAKITTIDVSRCTNLTYLDCSDNQLTDLDVSKNIHLTWLDCEYNRLSAKAINSIFKNLPVKKNGDGIICIAGNPFGNDEYNASIAKEKGWVLMYPHGVDDGRGDDEEEGCHDEFVKTIDDLQFTALGLACRNGNLDKVKELIQNGACTTACMGDDIFEYDALYVSVRFGKPNLVNYLIQQGEDVKTVYGESGTTLLSMACLNEDKTIALKMAELLIKAGASVQAEPNFDGGYTCVPLHYAAGKNNLPLVKLLVEQGADIHIKNGEGMTIFQMATDWEHLDTDMKEYIRSLQD
ncbi:hypothetical protein FACS1894199_01260 [Bacteroidia bacterium]|nr:hypothetical protein FACS1894199_01260 [Bacteroidia bacterium]